MFILKEKKKKLKSSLAFCFLLLIKFYINLGALESGYSPCRVHSYRSASLFHAFLTGEVLGQPYSLACFMVSIPGEKKLPLTKYFLFISHSLFQAGTGKLQATSLGLFNKNADLPGHTTGPGGLFTPYTSEQRKCRTSACHYGK